MSQLPIDPDADVTNLHSLAVIDTAANVAIRAIDSEFIYITDYLNGALTVISTALMRPRAEGP